MSIIPIKPAVITIFGQALSAHCHPTSICHKDENGHKYGMGH